MDAIDAALLTLWSPALKLIVKELQDSLSDTTPQVSTLCVPDITAHEHISQAFPLHICILHAIKYWRHLPDLSP